MRPYLPAICLLAAALFTAPTPCLAAATCKSYDACNVLLPEDVSSELKVTYGPGVKGPDFEETPSSAEGKNCEYKAARPDPRVRLMIRCFSGGDNAPDTVRGALVAMYKTVTDVSGLGDRAFWGFDAGGGNGQLNAFVGKNLYLLLHFHQKGATSEAALAHAKQLMSAALKRL